MLYQQYKISTHLFVFFSLYFSYLKCHMVRATKEDLDFFGFIYSVLISHFLKVGHLSCLFKGVRNGAAYSVWQPRTSVPHQRGVRMVWELSALASKKHAPSAGQINVWWPQIKCLHFKVTALRFRSMQRRESLGDWRKSKPVHQP